MSITDRMGVLEGDVRKATKDEQDGIKSQGGQMQHKVIKAATTTTDQGQFTAIAAAYSVDRGNEQIERGAFAKTIARWQGSGKQIPLHWDHSASPEDIIGSVDPAEMREADEGLYVKGQLDLENSGVAREAWRLMKANVVSLSFGYLVNEDEEIDGVKHLKAIDLFELTITPAPMNPDTRVLDMKSAKRELAREFVKEVKELSEEVQERRGMIQDALEDKEAKREAEAVTQARRDAESLEFEVATRGIEPKDAEIGFFREEAEKAPPVEEVYDRKTVAEVAPELEEEAEESPGEEAIEEAATEEPAERPAKVAAQDPLRKAYDDLAHELTTRGIPLAEPPKVEEPTEDLPSMAELRRQHYDLMLNILTEGKQ